MSLLDKSEERCLTNPLQRCHHYVKYIENLLGKTWLEEQKKQAKGHTNFLSLAWSEAVEILHHLEIKRFFLKLTPGQPSSAFEFVVSPNMLYLFAACRDLELAETLPNFQEGVPVKMLRNALDQPRYEYIARTAAMYSLSGYQVEFVPVSVSQGERTPDLMIKFNDSDIYIECKRKDDFQIKESDKTWTESLIEELLELETLVIQDGSLSSEGRQVAVMTTGKLSVDDKIVMTDFIREKLETKEIGLFRLPSSEALVSVKIADPLPFSPALGSGYAWLPDSAYAGNATTVFRLNKDGITEILKEFKVLVYTFDSSKVSSIINSFDDARGQLPKDSFGIIHIDLDVSKIRTQDLETYLDLINEAVRDKLSTKKNTRVKAVVVSTVPEPTDLNGFPVISWLRIIHNEYHSLPEGFHIPKEHKYSIFDEVL